MNASALSAPRADNGRNKAKAFLARFPLLSAVMTTLVAMLCLLLPLWIPGLSPAARIVLGRVAICILAICMLAYLHWWRETGFVRPASWRIVLPYLPVILLIIAGKTVDVVVLGIRVPDAGLLLLGLAVYLAGGFMEEAVFRGLVFRILLPVGLMQAALLSSLLFALAHLLNLLIGANLAATILQVAMAFLTGLAFVAPLAYTGNIWPLVLIHGVGNFVTFLNVGGFLNTAATSRAPSWVDVVLNVLPYLLLAAYSVWLLRRADRNRRRDAARPGGEVRDAMSVA